MGVLQFADHATVYVLVAVLCLLLAVHFMRSALAPIGPLVHAVVAVALVALAIGAALVFLTAALLGGSLP
jgi:hypothetical protein